MPEQKNVAIAAIATPPGQGGLGVVRVSGDGALAVGQAMFRPVSGVPLSEKKGYTAAFGTVFDAKGDADRAVALVFRAPHSYTGEDTVEFSCHGGTAVLRRVLAAALAAGARMAQPGEFTRRAFLNGKMDLTEAEAVMQLIGARSGAAARAALAQHEGALFRRVQAVKEPLVQLLAELAAYFDYPDDDIPALTPRALMPRVRALCERTRALCDTYEAGRAVRDGVRVAIAGRPNAGKSTLMNRLLGVERSIVTDVAGTTRDVVEESAAFAGTTLRLLDTAGLRETDDPVERIGVRRARQAVESAALVLAVFDASQPLEDEDRALMQALAGRPAVAVLNKADLPAQCDAAAVRAAFAETVSLCAAGQEPLTELEAAVRRVLALDAFSPDEGAVANARQLDCALRAKNALADALRALETGVTLDAVSVTLESAAVALAELTGERVSDAVVEKVFAQFCVGK